MQIVKMDEESEDSPMKAGGFRKGKGFAYKATDMLFEGVVDMFNMSGLPTFFAKRLIGFFGKNSLISIPKIAIKTTLLESLGNAVSEGRTGALAAIAYHKGHHTHCNRCNDISGSFCHPDHS